MKARQARQHQHALVDHRACAVWAAKVCPFIGIADKTASIWKPSQKGSESRKEERRKRKELRAVIASGNLSDLFLVFWLPNFEPLFPAFLIQPPSSFRDEHKHSLT